MKQFYSFFHKKTAMKHIFVAFCLLFLGITPLHTQSPTDGRQILGDILSNEEIDLIYQLDFNRRGAEIFVESLWRELDYINFERQRLERDRERVTRGEIVQRPRGLSYSEWFARWGRSLDEKRKGALDTALKATTTHRPTLTRARLDWQDFVRGLSVDTGGKLTDNLGDSLAAQTWKKHWDKKGIILGVSELGLSMVTAPVRGMDKVSIVKFRINGSF